MDRRRVGLESKCRSFTSVSNHEESLCQLSEETMNEQERIQRELQQERRTMHRQKLLKRLRKMERTKRKTRSESGTVSKAS